MNIETTYFPRRTALLALAALIVNSSVFAQANSTKAIRMVVPFAAGGGSDVVARLVADGMREKLREPIIVENLAGANGNVGADAVARAKPDGRTLLFTPQSPITIAQFVEPKPTFDPERAFVPIAIVAKTPLVLLINSSVPANTLQELIAYSKANPKALNYGIPSTEFGFTTDLLAREAGLSMLGVPYRGSGQAMTDLLGGTIQVLLSSGGPALAQLADKRVKALAVVGTSRSPDFPDIPSTREIGLRDLKVFGWFGIFAPAGTPEASLNTLTQAALGLSKDPGFVAKLKHAGYETMALDRAQSQIALTEHRTAWRRVAPQIVEK